jgi:hypothetical protein
MPAASSGVKRGVLGERPAAARETPLENRTFAPPGSLNCRRANSISPLAKPSWERAAEQAR